MAFIETKPFFPTIPFAGFEGGCDMKTKTISQSVTFKTSPHEVYEALMDAEKHAAFTGSEADISREAGGRFSVWGGSLEGENLKLVPDRKIVQSWRSDDWPEGHYSKVTFDLENTSGGTRLNFTQTGVPEEFYEDIRQGWHDYYWNPMKRYLES
jgi:activator of HSP90 ATPase